MAQFDELMQRALTVRNNVAPSSNTATLVGGVLVSIVSALQLLLDTKQGTLTFDNEPTDGSTNPVTSDGIYEAIADAIASIDLSACEKIINKVTAIDDESTDVQYPTAKLLYDSLQALSQVYAAIQHTHTAADIADLANTLAAYVTLAGAQTISGKKTLDAGVVNNSAYFQGVQTATLSSAAYSITSLKAHTLILAADVTITLPAVSDGAATLRIKFIQDATGGRNVNFAAGSGIDIYNPNEADLSAGAANQICWVTLLWDGTCWVWQSTPYVSPN